MVGETEEDGKGHEIDEDVQGYQIVTIQKFNINLKTTHSKLFTVYYRLIPPRL